MRRIIANIVAAIVFAACAIYLLGVCAAWQTVQVAP